MHLNKDSRTLPSFDHNGRTVNIAIVSSGMRQLNANNLAPEMRGNLPEDLICQILYISTILKHYLQNVSFKSNTNIKGHLLLTLCIC